ncbi:MAG: 3-hydroxyacyl-CoA dehydrogenase family protein [Deltaproteobacteria bacterium]|nr:3-hydroxyacyl-CoA dehydrogenase family protein [Deltaproteobacteria bacterium]
MKIETVTVIGANGNVGCKMGGLIAAFSGATVYMMARSMESAAAGIERALKSIKSGTIESRLIPCTFDDAQEVLAKSDWVFESVVEDFLVKSSVNKMIDKYVSDECIVSTGTSGISIDELSKVFSVSHQKNYFGTHFFNPPLKMTICEVIKSSNSDDAVVDEFEKYLRNILGRVIVLTGDFAAFAGNRIGFRLFEKAVSLVEREAENGGIDYVDYILGNTTGNTMAPLSTLDFVGLDVYASIVQNINEKLYPSSHKNIAGFIRQLIHNDFCGVKKSKGLYDYSQKVDGLNMVWDLREGKYKKSVPYNIPVVEEIKEMIRLGRYDHVVPALINKKSRVSKIILEYLISYLVFSCELVPSVVKDVKDVDTVMMHGFAWAPPGFWISLFLKNITIDEFFKIADELHIKMNSDVISIFKQLSFDENAFKAGRRFFAVDGF